jgi:hypothetical protein
MHLISRKAQTVRVLGRSFSFRAGETIHTEAAINTASNASSRWRRARAGRPPNPGPMRGMFSVHALVASD